MVPKAESGVGQVASGAAERPANPVLICGLTASGKSAAAALLHAYGGYKIMEMSACLYSSLSDKEASLDRLVALAEKERRERGNDILAVRMLEQVQTLQEPRIAISGVRSFDDFVFLRNALSPLTVIFVHCSPQTRQARLRRDGGRFYDGGRVRADRYSEGEQIDRIAAESHLVVVDDAGFPLTVLDQLRAFSRRSPGMLRLDSVRSLWDRRSIPFAKGHDDFVPPAWFQHLPEDLHELGDSGGFHFHSFSEQLTVVVEGEAEVTLRRSNSLGGNVIQLTVSSTRGIKLFPGWSHRVRPLGSRTVILSGRRTGPSGPPQGEPDSTMDFQ